MSFKEKWLESVEKQNSVLCAGLDPAEFEMGRGKKGLSEGTDKRQWALDYIAAVAPYCAAVKPNVQYWKDGDDMKTLAEICRLAHELGMVAIDDSKLADIGSTNDSGVYYSGKKIFDAVTYSPFAGNMEEVAEQGENRGVGIIAMCLMSNPEYEREKNKLVDMTGKGEFDTKDIVFMKDGIRNFTCVRQYIQLAHDANKYGIDALVIGAPSSKNHISNEEIKNVRSYVGDDMLVLLPGVGAQGGEADAIWKYFGKDNVIVNVGRSLMFPGDDGWKKKAETYKNMLNELRNKK